MSLNRKEYKKSPVSVVCSALGTVLLIMLVVICLPLTAPRLFGYHIYSVISGSMEPEIPTGSLVYIKEAVPEEIQEGDVIAFYGAMDSNAIITHRVVENRVLMGEFITKGDANQTEDMNPIPYDNFIGIVVRSIPKVGQIAQLFTSQTGKIIAGMVIGISIVLQCAASLIESRRRKKRN
ncbi:MAG: signal peptidase I [Clostridiales bacterium]|nr:signal peptidase I [Clostridiales bacterium]